MTDSSNDLENHKMVGAEADAAADAKNLNVKTQVEVSQDKKELAIIADHESNDVAEAMLDGQPEL